jgi:hypothetical protein
MEPIMHYYKATVKPEEFYRLCKIVNKDNIRSDMETKLTGDDDITILLESSEPLSNDLRNRFTEISFDRYLIEVVLVRQIGTSGFFTLMRSSAWHFSTTSLRNSSFV